MPRPLRIEFPRACCHVICRGNARLPIFGDDADKKLLLDQMLYFAEPFRLEVRAYCVRDDQPRPYPSPNTGSERFTDRFRRGLNDLKENLDVRRESSQHRRLTHGFPSKTWLQAVGKAYRCPRSQLLRRHNRNCEARQALLYLAATHCRGRYSLTELGENLAPYPLAAVSNARAGMARRMKTSSELKKRIDEISASLESEHDKVKLED